MKTKASILLSLCLALSLISIGQYQPSVNLNVLMIPDGIGIGFSWDQEKHGWDVAIGHPSPTSTDRGMITRTVFSASFRLKYNMFNKTSSRKQFTRIGVHNSPIAHPNSSQIVQLNLDDLYLSIRSGHRFNIGERFGLSTEIGTSISARPTHSLSVDGSTQRSHFHLALGVSLNYTFLKRGDISKTGARAS